MAITPTTTRSPEDICRLAYEALELIEDVAAADPDWATTWLTTDPETGIKCSTAEKVLLSPKNLEQVGEARKALAVLLGFE